MREGVTAGLECRPLIFVFGSNLAGRHGKGAALFARKSHGAEYGVGVGRTGRAYAIPTRDERIRTLPLHKIEKYITEFLTYAREHPELEFQITKIGCGLAGYREHEIKPLFSRAPINCHLPEGWRSDKQKGLSALKEQDCKLCLKVPCICVKMMKKPTACRLSEVDIKTNKEFIIRSREAGASYARPGWDGWE